jgi:FtsP/CotA-like multicopper oxidase with cupredoxin domain
VPKLTRSRLLAGAAPLLAAPVVGKLARDAMAADGDERHLQSHRHGHPGSAHASMIGEHVPAVAGPHLLDDLLYPPPALPYEPGRVREYTLSAIDVDVEIAPGVFFPGWTYNGTIPGPVIRATEDDLLRVRFSNGGSSADSNDPRRGVVGGPRRPRHDLSD